MLSCGHIFFLQQYFFMEMRPCLASGVLIENVIHLNELV